MTRKQYLDKLQRRLCFLLPDGEVSEILCDMEECFDAGAAEGKSEEDICGELGDPAQTAKEILAERGRPAPVTHSQVAEKYLPPLISALLGLFFFWWTARSANRYGSDEWYSLVIGILLPPVIWLILERKNFFRSLRADKADIFSLAGAALMFAAAALFMPYSNAILGESLQAASYISMAQAAVMICAQIMLIMSVLKSDMPKLLAAVPAALAMVPLVAEFLSVYTLSTIGTGFYYYPYFGRVLNLYSMVIIASLVLFMLWAVVNKNAFSVPALYLSVMGGLAACQWRAALATTDPTNPYSFIKTGAFVPAGAIAAAVSFTAIVVISLVHRRKGGDV